MQQSPKANHLAGQCHLLGFDPCKPQTNRLKRMFIEWIAQAVPLVTRAQHPVWPSSKGEFRRSLKCSQMQGKILQSTSLRLEMQSSCSVDKIVTMITSICSNISHRRSSKHLETEFPLGTPKTKSSSKTKLR